MMDIFSLPHTTIVDKFIPKKAFDSYSTSNQKKLFTDKILRITWSYKLSPATVNLEAKDIKEIQIFKVELKIKEDIKTLLDIIDKAIPYSIIFIVEYGKHIYLSASVKHPHPLNEDNAVVDWTFRSDWFTPGTNKYKLNLKKSLDAVFQDFCTQLSEINHLSNKSFTSLIEQSKSIDSMKKEVLSLKTAIAKCRQFNQKVELNIKLKSAESKLKKMLY